MNTGRFIKAIAPAGPLLSLALIGVMMLSATLYYRAVRIQRFLEPSVAITAPRITFYRKVSNLIIEEFGSSEIAGLIFNGDELLVHKALLYKDADVRGASPAMRKLGHIFFLALEDPAMRPYIDSIIISTRAPMSADAEKNTKTHDFHQAEARFIQNALYLVEPQLNIKYPQYFESSVIMAAMRQEDSEWVVFRLIPSDRPNMDMLQQLRKYSN